MGFNPVDLAFGNMDALKSDNKRLRELVADCHSLLQHCCETEDKRGCDCPMWLDHSDECNLRKIEQRMHDLGIEVDE